MPNTNDVAILRHNSANWEPRALPSVAENSLLVLNPTTQLVEPATKVPVVTLSERAAAPDAPSAGTVLLYVIESGGTRTLQMMMSDGNTEDVAVYTPA